MQLEDAVQRIDKRQAFLKQLSCPFHLERHEIAKSGGGLATRKLLVCVSEPAQVLLREVDPTHGVVALDVLPEVGELEGSAGGV